MRLLEREEIRKSLVWKKIRILILILESIRCISHAFLMCDTTIFSQAFSQKMALTFFKHLCELIIKYKISSFGQFSLTLPCLAQDFLTMSYE